MARLAAKIIVTWSMSVLDQEIFEWMLIVTVANPRMVASCSILIFQDSIYDSACVWLAAFCICQWRSLPAT